jgi:hypothetical protein
MARLHHIAGLMAPLLLLASQATAEDPEVQQLRDQLRATVLQLRQLQDQQASTPQASAPAPATPAAGAADKATVAAEARARAAGARAGRLQAELAKANSENAALKTAATSSASDLDSLKALYQRSADAGRALTVENSQLKDQLATLTRVAAVCQRKNDRLSVLAEQLVTAYSKVGVGQILESREPFTGLKRVQIEKAAEDQEDSIRGLRCDVRLDAAPPVVTPPAAKPRPGSGS